jgi:glycosyltransferase involved in cell wall biosynthesis
MKLPEIGVIMPTLGAPERAPLFRRALRSVLSQEGVRAVPLVVFNGQGVDPVVLQEAQDDAHIRTLVLEQTDLPAALLAGRRLVEQPWFAELDDDDELLPGALALRVQVLEALPDHGAVVTNGIRRGSDNDILHLPDAKVFEPDPLRALLELNWLLPGSWLCRTDAVGESVFVGIPRYLECTFIAARLATLTSLAFVQEPTVVYHEDTPGSESKSSRYVLGQEAALRRILELELPPDVRRLFELRLARACWSAALLHAASGDLRPASRQWARGLRYPGGWRLLPRAVKLLWPSAAG